MVCYPQNVQRKHMRESRRGNSNCEWGLLSNPQKQERPESSKKPQVSKNGVVETKKRVDFSENDDDFILKHKKSKA